PVVMAGSSDPVGEGFVQSLGHPGGNFTGLSFQGVELLGKRLELLKELVPGAAPVAVLWERASLVAWQAVATAARERQQLPSALPGSGGDRLPRHEAGPFP